VTGESLPATHAANIAPIEQDPLETSHGQYV